MVAGNSNNLLASPRHSRPIDRNQLNMRLACRMYLMFSVSVRVGSLEDAASGRPGRRLGRRGRGRISRRGRNRLRVGRQQQDDQ